MFSAVLLVLCSRGSGDCQIRPTDSLHSQEIIATLQGWNPEGCNFLRTHDTNLQLLFPPNNITVILSPLASHTVSYYKENSLLIWPLSPAPSGQIAVGTSSYSRYYSSSAKPEQHKHGVIHSFTSQIWRGKSVVMHKKEFCRVKDLQDFIYCYSDIY